MMQRYQELLDAVMRTANNQEYWGSELPLNFKLNKM